MKKRQEKKMIGITRAEFLRMAGATCALGATTSFQSFIGAIANGLIASAQAQELGATSPRNYVAMLFPRAPSRWMWDSMLAPNRPQNSLLTPAGLASIGSLSNLPTGFDPFVSNIGMGNWISDNVYSADNSKVQYRFEPVVLSDGRVIFAPPLWNRTIPIVGGGSVPMKVLLESAHILRGIDMQADQGHSVTRVTRPIATEPSINGIVADASHLPISAVGTSIGIGPQLGGYASRSGKGMSMVSHLQPSPLDMLLGPFVSSSPDSANSMSVTQQAGKRQNLRPHIDAVLNALKAHTATERPGSDILYANRSKAEALFTRSFGNLLDEYTLLFNKYSDLQSRCLAEIPNILPSASTVAGYNLATGAFGTSLPAQFAIAEFVIRNKLSSSITMSGVEEGIFGTRVGNLFNDNDEHGQTNRQLAVICHSFQFRVLAAMIYEFQNAIGSAAWEQTVLHVSSEFDRMPRNDQIGSEHASDSNVHAMFSGAINKFMLVGNIKVNARPTSPNTDGTFGAAGLTNTNFGMQNLNLEHAASTVCSLLGVASPTRARTLIVPGTSGFQSEAEPPKNV